MRQALQSTLSLKMKSFTQRQLRSLSRATRITVILIPNVNQNRIYPFDNDITYYEKYLRKIRKNDHRHDTQYIKK